MKKSLILLFLGLSFISCGSVKKTCFCRYNLYKPVDRNHSTIGICMYNGNFSSVSNFFTEKKDIVRKTTPEEIETLKPIVQRFDDDEYGTFTDEEIAILNNVKDTLKVDLILVAKNKQEVLSAGKREFNFVILYTFDIGNDCCTYYQKEYFPPEETFDTKLMEMIKADYEW